MLVSSVVFLFVVITLVLAFPQLFENALYDIVCVEKNPILKVLGIAKGRGWYLKQRAKFSIWKHISFLFLNFSLRKT